MSIVEQLKKRIGKRKLLGKLLTVKDREIAAAFNVDEEIKKAQLIREAKLKKDNMNTLSYLDLSNRIIYWCTQGLVDLNGVKLSKLVYIVNAMELALYGRPLIEENIVVCNYGPGIKEVLLRYGPETILSPHNSVNPINYPLTENLEVEDVYDSEIRNKLHTQLTKFASYSAFQLTEIITSKLSGWNEVRKQPIYSVIEKDTLQEMADKLFTNVFGFSPVIMRNQYLKIKEEENASN